MQRIVTVVAVATGAAADVRLDASTSTLADVLPELLQLTGTSAAPVSCNGVLLDPRQPVAHLQDGDVLAIGADARATGATPVRLEVLAGPDAGRLARLRPGRHCVGRDGSALRVGDPLVSRRHVEVVVTDDGDVSVVDLDSRNGSRFENGNEAAAETLQPGRPTPWPAGTVLRLGDTRLVHGRVAAQAATSPGPGGSVLVNRPPRMVATPAPVTVKFPAPPPPVTTGRVPLLASLAPLAAGVVLALVLRRWEFLAFALMSPLVVLGQAGSDRWAARRANNKAAAEHAATTASAEETLRAAVVAEAAHRHLRTPDLATLVAAATDRTSLLWQRGHEDTDTLTLRLGTGSLPASVEIDGDHARPTLHDVPVSVDLRRGRVLGVAGPAALAAGVARSLLVQAATLVGPADLRITVLAPGRTAQWAWTRWLPHLRGDGETIALALTTPQVRAQLDYLRGATPARQDLVVVDGAVEPAVAAALSARPATSVLWVSGSQATLPAACDGVVGVMTTGDRATLRLRMGDLDLSGIAPDVLPLDVAETVARALCPLRDGADVARSIPAVIAWSQLNDVPLHDDEASAAALVRRWAAGPSTTICLGMSADGPLLLDLQTDGPHMLVAGTTGAGKSELLQALVASLVAGNSPADLNLMLVDFKGGAAFGPCTDLPHTIGVLTDLDAAATTRAIESLTAELRRRERILAGAGAADVEAWRAQRLCAGEPAVGLPRLVIVVDEFATLAEELPDFVGGLVGVAQRGRSLGVHLVLATQRPEGAVSADIRANARLRVCLAVAREAESRDVIDSPRALTISRATPGRALVRVGAQELVEVQTARVAAPATVKDPSRSLVTLLPVAACGGAVTTAPATPETSTELNLLVASAARAAAVSGATAPAPPWLPPLPAEVSLSSLPCDGTCDAIAIGLMDLPQDQQQPALTVSPAVTEPLLLVGGARSGRTTGVLTIATALASALSPNRLHIWALDGGRGLDELRDLPHTGAVVDVRDTERVDRLLTFLTAEVERRRGAPDPERPQLLLALDSWDALVADTGDTDAGRCQDLLLRLLEQGPAAGLRIVVTGDRGGLTGRLSAAIGNRICLRLPDPADYALLGVPARQVPTKLPPGRGIRAGDLTHVQLATPDQQARDVALAWTAPTTPPRRFDPLPARVPLHAIHRTGAEGLVVGLRGDDLAPVVLDPDEIGGALLVAGPPRSGRSTALVSIAAQLRERPVVALCARRGPMRQRRDLALVADPAVPAEARAALDAVVDGAALLVDDIDLVDDAAVLDGIEAAVRRARDGGGLVVLAGTTEAMAASFRGPVAQARRGRSGLLLRPDGPHDGDLLGVRLRRRPSSGDPPGRGFLALHGQVVPVQVPDPH